MPQCIKKGRNPFVPPIITHQNQSELFWRDLKCSPCSLPERRANRRIKHRVVQTKMKDGDAVGSPVKLFDFTGSFARIDYELRLAIFVGAPLHQNRNAIIKPTMEQSRPLPKGIPQKTHPSAYLPGIFSKNNVHADGIGIQAIRARAKNQIVPQVPEALVPVTQKPISRQPPQEV